MCAAFGLCDSGLPTFAVTLTGTMSGCVASNAVLSAVTLGFNEGVGEALSSADYGFGVSVGGKFVVSPNCQPNCKPGQQEQEQIALWVEPGFGTMNLQEQKAHVWVQQDIGLFKGKLVKDEILNLKNFFMGLSINDIRF